MVKPSYSGVFLLLAVSIAACSTPVNSPSPSADVSAGPSSSPIALFPPPDLMENDLPLTCGSPLTFSAEALLGIPGAEAADHPAAEALRVLIANSPPLPTRPGWRIVVLSDTSALFVLPATTDEGSAFWSAEFQRIDSSWEYVRSGQCNVHPSFEGVDPLVGSLPQANNPVPIPEP